MLRVARVVVKYILIEPYEMRIIFLLETNRPVFSRSFPNS